MAYQDVFTALADTTRREIFESMREAPMSVSELTVGRSVSRPAVSQHLKVLQRAGLVDVSPKGNRRYYRIRRSGLMELRRYLDSFWSDALQAYGDEIERRNRREDDA